MSTESIVEASYLQFALILLCLFLSSVHQASSHALPANPPNTPSKPSFQNHNSITIDQNIGTLVRTLAKSPDIRYREASMVAVYLAVEHVEDIEGVEDITFSSNIGDFRDMLCLFRYGGPQPLRPERSLFKVKNRWPVHWEQWAHPEPYHVYSENLAPFRWQDASRRMSVEWADVLLKSNGHRGRYGFVFLARTETEELSGPLAWCFGAVETPEGPRVFWVEVNTGQVLEVPFCTFT